MYPLHHESTPGMMIDIACTIIAVTVLLLLLAIACRRRWAFVDTAPTLERLPAPIMLTKALAEPVDKVESTDAGTDGGQTPNLTFPDRHELTQLICRTPELRDLYATLGYAPALEQQAAQLLHEAIALIETTLPDFTAFRRSVLQVQSQLDEPAPGSATMAMLWQERRQKAHTDPLWQAVLTAGDDQTQVLALLNTNAVFAQLPFIEQVPYLSHGQVMWRIPVEVPGLRKRPRDLQRFVMLLDRLEELISTPGVVWHEQTRRDVLNEIARVRRELQRPHGYLPTRLQALQKKVSHCTQQAPFATAHAQREALDRCLSTCLAVRQAYGWEHRRPLSSVGLAQMREMTQQQAHDYLYTAWMHTPWLTTRLLTNLLDADLAAVPAAVWHHAPSPAEPLALIRAEVAAGLYDPEETLRRLRQCEERGVYVHSLAYPLLRLQRTPDVPWHTVRGSLTMR